MKLLTIGSQFLAGAIGVTLLGWVLSLTPFFLRASIITGGLSIILYLAAWGLDDWVIGYLQINHLQYYSFLVALGFTAIVSIAVTVFIISL